MLSKQSVDSLINSNARVHGRDLIVEIVMLVDGEVGWHCGWLSSGLGKGGTVFRATAKDSKSRGYCREVLNTGESN